MKTPVSATATLSLAINIKSKEESNAPPALHVVTSVFNSESIDTATDKNAKESLVSIFQLLHPILVLSSRDQFNQKYNSLQSSGMIGQGSGDTEHCDTLFEMAVADDSCLSRCIFALATGKIPVSEAAHLMQRKKMIESWAIVDMIRNHSERSGRGALKDFIGKQLMVNCAPQALYRTLNYTGISTSNATVRLDSLKDSNAKILAGYSFEGKKYDLFLILFDNLGFRVRGGKDNKVGYEQYTALEIVNISKKQLIEWGVYPNAKTNAPGKSMMISIVYFIQMFAYLSFLSNSLILTSGASRERKDWKYAKRNEESSFEIVATPNMNDYNLLGESILEFIEVVMDFESSGKFPSIDMAKELLNDKEKMKYFDLEIPDLRKGVNLGGDQEVFDIEESGEGAKETVSATFETNYDANAAIVDVPLQYDLAADKTLDILLSYSETLADNCLKEDETSEEEGFTPITSEISPYLCGDGNPIWGIYKKLRKCGSAKYKRKMPAYFGGFHLVLETHKKRGSLFGDTHLRDVFRRWRPSDKMLDWVMSPGDPNQINSEMVMYHLGK